MATRGWRTAGWRVVAIGAIIGATAGALLAMGRSAVCRCGAVRLWAGEVHSAENSQQLADWYSLSHVVHGLLFYAAGWIALRQLSVATRLVLAVAVEAAWEVIENSPLIIDRYRAVTLAWGYAGDSVVNSVSDIAMMMLGFLLASRLPAWAAAALGVGLELLSLWAIRDNLTLNVWMLLAPDPAIVRWQNG